MAELAHTFNEKFNAADADIIFRADGAVPPVRRGQKPIARLFRVKMANLVRSSVMRSMMEDGQNDVKVEDGDCKVKKEDSKSDVTAGLPVVALSETPIVVEILLSYLSNDFPALPNVDSMTADNAIEIFEASDKYGMPLVMNIMEQAIIYRLWNSASLQHSTKSHVVAKRLGRKSLLEVCRKRIAMFAPEDWAPYIAVLDKEDIYALAILHATYVRQGKRWY